MSSLPPKRDWGPIRDKMAGGENVSSSTYFLRAFPMKGRAYIEAEEVIVIKNALVVVRDEHDVIWGGLQVHSTTWCHVSWR